MTMEGGNVSVIGRLVEEISWEGARVKQYRQGGRGMENVLTAEVLLPLTYLPRGPFLAPVLRGAHGASAAVELAAAEAEDAELVLLPEQSVLPGEVVVQPDAELTSASVYTLVEAKRIRRSAFQPEQLARELVAAVMNAGDRTALVLLILGTPPPVSVRGLGRVALRDAVAHGLSGLAARGSIEEASIPGLLADADSVFAWTTWSDVASAVQNEARSFTTGDPSVDRTIARLVNDLTGAVARHT